MLPDVDRLLQITRFLTFLIKSLPVYQGVCLFVHRMRGTPQTDLERQTPNAVPILLIYHSLPHGAPNTLTEFGGDQRETRRQTNRLAFIYYSYSVDTICPYMAYVYSYSGSLCLAPRYPGDRFTYPFFSVL